jgi:hypothetical protein
VAIVIDHYVDYFLCMNALKNIRTYLLVSSLVVALQPLHALAQQPAPTARDGQHDFDFEIGVWKTHISRLQHPLTGSNTWVEYEGSSVVRKVWNGRANVVELEVDGSAGHIEGLSLRLYNPQSHQWSLNFANSNGGSLGQATVGEFKNGRGEFFDQEPFNGRTILVRNVLSDITPNSYRFEQAFSDDGGKTWEGNWVATDTRVQDESNGSDKSVQPTSKDHEGQNDFDFEIGSWSIHLSRLQDRLAGSTTWVKFDGTSVTRKIWDGRANLNEFEADSSQGHIEGLTLRLYNPQSHQWSIYWANGKDATIDQPMIGEFKNGRGEFFDQETWKGRAVFVRFIWSDTATKSPHFEQSYSDDGGTTWEVNWITNQTRAQVEPDEAH